MITRDQVREALEALWTLPGNTLITVSAGTRTRTMTRDELFAEGDGSVEATLDLWDDYNQDEAAAILAAAAQYAPETSGLPWWTYGLIAVGATGLGWALWKAMR